jgi:hypothetical protein
MARAIALTRKQITSSKGLIARALSKLRLASLRFHSDCWIELLQRGTLHLVIGDQKAAYAHGTKP